MPNRRWILGGAAAVALAVVGALWRLESADALRPTGSRAAPDDGDTTEVWAQCVGVGVVTERDSGRRPEAFDTPPDHRNHQRHDNETPPAVTRCGVDDRRQVEHRDRDRRERRLLGVLDEWERDLQSDRGQREQPRESHGKS